MGATRRATAGRYTCRVTDVRPLCSQFSRGFGEGAPPSSDALEAALVKALGEAEAVHPKVKWPSSEFASVVGARLSGARVDATSLPAVVDDLAALALVDLRLAAAAAAGDREALKILDRDYLGDSLARRLVGLRLSESELDEVRQRVRVDVFAPRDDGPPRIGEYEGRGPLAAWLRVTATRIVFKMRRGKVNQADSDEDALLEERSAGDDPELAHFKRVYRVAFKASFEEALPSLTDKERLLLRQSVLDGLGIDELGALHGVHRSTAARWLESARAHLFDETKKRFMARANVDPKGLASVLRLVESQLDMSLRRVL